MNDQINKSIIQKCNNKTEIYSRVVGLYSPVENWNLAKQEEFDERKTFVIEDNED